MIISCDSDQILFMFGSVINFDIASKLSDTDTFIWLFSESWKWKFFKFVFIYLLLFLLYFLKLLSICLMFI